MRLHIVHFLPSGCALPTHSPVITPLLQSTTYILLYYLYIYILECKIHGPMIYLTGHTRFTPYLNYRARRLVFAPWLPLMIREVSSSKSKCLSSLYTNHLSTHIYHQFIGSFILNCQYFFLIISKTYQTSPTHINPAHI